MLIDYILKNLVEDVAEESRGKKEKKQGEKNNCNYNLDTILNYNLYG